MYKDASSIRHCYNTPRYLFNYLDKYFHFQLDPCDDGSKWLGLPYNFTREDDGLAKSWKYNAFVNPPYGADYENKWLDKCIEESKKNDIVVFLLLPSKTEAPWFSKAMKHASIIIFPQKRINFVKGNKTVHGNTMGSVLFGFFQWVGIQMPTKHGKQADKFYDESRWGYSVPTVLGNGQIILFPMRELLEREYG